MQNKSITRKPRLTTLAAIVAATFPGVVMAEARLMLDPVVVSGSRIEHDSFDLPASVDVVDAARIGADQARVNASEALASVPGLVIQNRQNYAQDLQISSRGFGARTAFGVRGIRLVADGIPASTPDGQGQAATFNLDRAERIEVLRGPMTSVYGNASGGVIQVFTPDGQGAPTIDSRFSAGNNNTWKADVGAQGEAGGVGYVIDTSRFATDGYRQHSAAEREQSMVKLTVRPSDDGKLTFVASSFRQKADDPLGLDWAGYRTNPRGVAQTAIDYNTRKTIDQMQGGLNYEHRFGDHLVQLSAYSGQRSVTQFQSIPSSSQDIKKYPKSPGGVIDFDRDYYGASARWIGRFEVSGGKLTTTLGTDYDRSTDDRRGYENFLGSAATPTAKGVLGRLRRNEQDQVTSLDQYAQAEWQGERWNFSAGARHSRIEFNVDDYYLANGNDSGGVSYDKSTATAAAVYKLSPAINLYASAATGFETPSLNELFYSGSGGTFSFNLKPMTSTHLETGVKAWVSDNSRLDVALFDIQTEDELVVSASSGGRTSYRNAGKTSRQGVELAVDSVWGYGLSSRLAYTALQAKFDEGYTGTSGLVAAGNRLPGVPSSQLFGELVWKHAASGFHAAVEGVARSKIYVEDTNQETAAPAYAIANLRVGIDRQYGQLKLGTFLRVDNVFDRQYVGSVIVGDTNKRFYEPAPGRSWLAGVSAKYAF